MAEIDALLSNMAKRGIDRVVLINDQPMRAFMGQREAQGGTFPLTKIFGMMREVVPSKHHTQLTEDCRFKFTYNTDAGFFDITVGRKANSIRVEVIAIAPVSNAPTSTSSSQWAPQLLSQPCGHEKAVTGVSIAPDGSLLVSAGLDGMVSIWRTETGQLQSILRQPTTAKKGVASVMGALVEQGVLCVIFSPDGQQVAAGTQMLVQIWAVKNAQATRKLQITNQAVTSMAFSPDGQTLALGTGASSGFSQAGANVVNAALIGSTLAGGGVHRAPRDTKGKLELWDFQSGKPKKRFRIWKDLSFLDMGARPFVSCVAFSANGQLVACGDNRNCVKLCELNPRPGSMLTRSIGLGASEHNYSQKLEFSSEVTSLAFAPQGSAIVIATVNKVVLHDFALQRTIWEQSISGTRTIAFSPQGTDIAAAGDDGQVHFLNVADGHSSHPPISHSESINAVTFSRDGRLLACGCVDGSLNIWRLW